MDMKGKIVDCHMHIVPGIDNGPTSFKMSIEMLKEAEQQGVTDIIATSHDWMIEDWDKYVDDFIRLQDLTKQNNIGINLYLGNEVYWDNECRFETERNIDNKTIYPLNGSDYYLVEFNPLSVTLQDILICMSAIYGSHKKMIIAHMEKYKYLFNNRNLLHTLKHIWGDDIRFQINLWSLIEEDDFSTSVLAKYLIKNRLVDFVGSDAHRTDHRPPKYTKGLNYINEHCDPSYRNRILYQNAEELLNVKGNCL